MTRLRTSVIFLTVLGRFACYLFALAAVWLGGFTYLSGQCSEGAGPRPDSLRCNEGLWAGVVALLVLAFVLLEVWLWRRRERPRG